MDNEKPDPESHPPETPNSVESEKDADGNLIAVGVGASAGGLEAFTELLRYLPPATGMAFILVQHLDPHHHSALPELLSAKTRMPVVQVQNDTPIKPDHPFGRTVFTGTHGSRRRTGACDGSLPLPERKVDSEELARRSAARGASSIVTTSPA